MDSLSAFSAKKVDGLLFCRRAYAAFEKVRNKPNGRSDLRMRRSSVEKKLIEEILPICKFIQSSYRTGRYIKVKWHNGNQNYDAKIEQSGELVEQGHYPAKGFLEVTCAVHPKDHLLREQIDRSAAQFDLLDDLEKDQNTKEITIALIGHTNPELIEEFAKILINRIYKKVHKKKPYPKHTTLIVQCTLNSVYEAEDWKLLQQIILEADIKHSFDEVFILEDVENRYFSL